MKARVLQLEQDLTLERKKLGDLRASHYRLAAEHEQKLLGTAGADGEENSPPRQAATHPAAAKNPPENSTPTSLINF